MPAGTAVAHAATERLDRLLGGPARRHVITAFACVLALDSADKATIGTSATQLQAGLGINKTQIGLLLAVTSLVGAVCTVPAGMLVDRFRRTRLLAGAALLWGAAMILSGIATGFLFLLLARVVLGLLAGVAGPAIASMIGDYFPTGERGRIYGFVLSGELIGAGVGFLGSGELAVLSWRAPFFFLALPSLVVWWLMSRLPEPARGGASRLPAGAQSLDEHTHADAADETGAQGGTEADSLAARRARKASIEPRDESIMREAPDRLTLRQAVRYVLGVRTNLVLIIASALGYFFFSGLRGFAVEFAKNQYGLAQSVATSLTVVLGIGALAGVLAGGRLADRLLRRGRVAARVEVAGAAVLCTGVVFVPAFTATSIIVALPLLLIAALFLGMANPPLDAARLDVIHPAVWGRAEGIRSVLRGVADAGAPVLVGILADDAFGGRSGLEYAMLVLLSVLFAGAIIMLTVARRTYPPDVAAAAVSTERH